MKIALSLKIQIEEPLDGLPFSLPVSLSPRLISMIMECSY